MKKRSILYVAKTLLAFMMMFVMINVKSFYVNAAVNPNGCGECHCVGINCGTQQCAEGCGGHDYRLDPSSFVAATCTTQSRVAERCPYCGDTKWTYGPALGHAWGSWQNNGSNHIRYCSRCGVSETQSHSWNHTSHTDESCSSWGNDHYNCSVCGAGRDDGISPHGHDWGNFTWVNEAQHRETCRHSSTGYHGCYCGVQQLDNHSWKTFTGDDGLAHAYQETNMWTHTQTCTECLAYDPNQQYKTAEHLHNFSDWTETSAGSGNFTRKCVDCGYVQTRTLKLVVNPGIWTYNFSTVTISSSDNGYGNATVEVYRVNVITGEKELLSGLTQVNGSVNANILSDHVTGKLGAASNITYTQTEEGVWYFQAVSTDAQGNKIVSNSPRIYIDHTDSYFDTITGQLSANSHPETIDDSNYEVFVKTESSINLRFGDELAGVRSITVTGPNVDKTVKNPDIWVSDPESSWGKTLLVNVPTTSDGHFNYTVVVKDYAGNEKTFHITITKDSTPPELKVGSYDRSGPIQSDIDDINGNGIVDEGETTDTFFNMLNDRTAITDLPVSRDMEHSISRPGGTEQTGDMDTVYCDDLSLVSVSTDGDRTNRTYQWTYGWVGGCDKFAIIDIRAFDKTTSVKSFNIYSADSNFAYEESFILPEAVMNGSEVRIGEDGLPIEPASWCNTLKGVNRWNKLLFVKREGITYYVIKIVDKLDNTTYVRLTVKVDRTSPYNEDTVSSSAPSNSDPYSTTQDARAAAALKSELELKTLEVTNALAALDRYDFETDRTFEETYGVNPEDYDSVENTFDAAHINYYVYVSASDYVNGIDFSGLDHFYVRVTNLDNGKVKVFDTSNSYYRNGGRSFHTGASRADIRINLLDDANRSYFYGNFEIQAVAVDVAHNISMSYSYMQEFNLKAYLTSKFFPAHDINSVYLRGEDVKLVVKTSGYVDALRIELPRELYYNPETDQRDSETYLRAYFNEGIAVKVIDDEGNITVLDPDENGIIYITEDVVQIDIPYDSSNLTGNNTFEIELLMPYFAQETDADGSLKEYKVKVTAYKNSSPGGAGIQISPNGDVGADVIELQRTMYFSLKGSVLDPFRDIMVTIY